MDAKCPHCERVIELVTQTDIAELGGVKLNTVGLWTKKGKLPTPWIEIANRSAWLRTTIDEYLTQRASAGAVELAEELSRSLSHLPETERKRILSLLS